MFLKVFIITLPMFIIGTNEYQKCRMLSFTKKRNANTFVLYSVKNAKPQKTKAKKNYFISISQNMIFAAVTAIFFQNLKMKSKIYFKTMFKHRKQIYKSKRELLLALIQLAYLEKKEQCKSRSFYYQHIETKKFYECKFQFDNNEIVSFAEKESETAFGEVEYSTSKPKKYRLRSYEHYDNFGIGYDTRDQVIEELKQHEGQRYTLEVDNNGNRVFVKYESGYLEYNGKKYKI